MSDFLSSEAFLSDLEERLRADQVYFFDNADEHSVWRDLVSLLQAGVPGEGRPCLAELEQSALETIETIIGAHPREQIREFWKTRTSDGLRFQSKQREMRGTPGELIEEPGKLDMTKAICRNLWQRLIERAAVEARSLGERDLEADWVDPVAFLRGTLAPLFRSKMPLVETTAEDAARLAQWIHLCASVPHFWPSDAPIMLLEETGTGNALLWLSYEEQTFQIQFFPGESGGETTPLLLGELSPIGVDPWKTKSLSKLSAALREPDYDLRFHFPDPMQDIPIYFWRPG